MLILKSAGPIVRYEFPATFRAQEAIQATAQRALENTKGVIDAINRIPESPLTPQELIKLTGSRFGVASVPPLRGVKPAGTKVGRNDLCPCGSGRKWKRCCGK